MPALATLNLYGNRPGLTEMDPEMPQPVKLKSCSMGDLPFVCPIADWAKTLCSAECGAEGSAAANATTLANATRRPAAGVEV